MRAWLRRLLWRWRRRRRPSAPSTARAEFVRWLETSPLPKRPLGWQCDACGALWPERTLGVCGPMLPGPYTDHVPCEHPKLRAMTHPGAMVFVMEGPTT